MTGYSLIVAKEGCHLGLGRLGFFPPHLSAAMPAAHNASCVVCAAAPGKYTCPYCMENTCSLACFRIHKSEASCAKARSEHERASTWGPASLLARSRGDVSRFVPMRDYDYNQMMQDYQFLSQVGRVVTSAGRELTDSNLVSDDKSKPGPPRRLTASQQRREQLAKQLGFQRLPIMLLPNGMSKRKQNRTSWESKYVCITLTDTQKAAHGFHCTIFISLRKSE